MDHCHTTPPSSSPDPKMSGCCHPKKRRVDYFFWFSFILVGSGYVLHLVSGQPLRDPTWLERYGASTFALIQKMWWGIALGMFFVGLLNKIPREFIVAILGNRRGISGILRATLAGLLLDLCSHGILLVGTKLYERGASLGQMIAFLVASPWNSISLTLVLISLVGLPWTLAFVFLSAAVAILTGLCFEKLVDLKILPPNPHQVSLPEDFSFWRQARAGLGTVSFDLRFWVDTLKSGVKDSKMILRWIFFGILIAALVQTFVNTHHLNEYFGPTWVGLGWTLFFATIIEVCSEGSTPLAADLLLRAQAPGNSFAFLMTGIATDYTEIMAIKETTRSFKIGLFLPLVTVPQVVLIAWILNHF